MWDNAINAQTTHYFKYKHVDILQREILYMTFKVSTQKNHFYFPPMESLRLF